MRNDLRNRIEQLELESPTLRRRAGMVIQRPGETVAELEARAGVERGDAETMFVVLLVKPGEATPSP